MKAGGGIPVPWLPEIGIDPGKGEQKALIATVIDQL